ncbi:MAG: hypothetical protein HQ495_00470 [Alphaproteobacteria bacterium]|nr:hypothetical protein [Alphaproteobacteria bacterium]
MRNVTHLVWPLAAVIVLLAVGVSTLVVAFNDGTRRLGPAPLHAEIVVTPFVSIPIEGLTYTDIEGFLRPHLMRRLEDDGPLRFRTQPQVLRSARIVAPMLLRDGDIAREFEQIPAVSALRAAEDFKGFARVTLANKSAANLTDVAIRLPGARVARITRTTVVPDEDAGSGATKKIVEATTVTAEKSVIFVGGITGETALEIDAWLDRTPPRSNWEWAGAVRLISSAGAGSYRVHQLVNPIVEGFDRYPLIGAAAIAVLSVLIAALSIAFGVALYWRSRNRKPPQEMAW